MRHVLFVYLLLVSMAGAAPAQELSVRPQQPAATPQKSIPANSDPVYQQLRNDTLSGEVASVQNLTLQRDATTFAFRTGKFYFLSPVNGKITGAVFVGDGTLLIAPTSQHERQSISRLTKQDKLEDTFSQLALRFTDGTYEEIKKQAEISHGDAREAAGVLDDLNSALRNKLHHNLHARVLQGCSE